MQLEMGSTHLWRVVCGVPPQTSSYHFAEPNSRPNGSYETDGETIRARAAARHVEHNCPVG